MKDDTPKKADKPKAKARHLETGEWGEKQAEKALKKKKYKILGRRVLVPPHDELDIVARDGTELVFVEVKTRKNLAFGRPSSSVDRKKRSKICRAAVRYIKRLKNPAVCFRFDIVEVIGEIGGTNTVIRHIENAFQLDKRYMPPC